jgi:hypothetical protein
MQDKDRSVCGKILKILQPSFLLYKKPTPFLRHVPSTRLHNHMESRKVDTCTLDFQYVIGYTNPLLCPKKGKPLVTRNIKRQGWKDKRKLEMKINK